MISSNLVSQPHTKFSKRLRLAGDETIINQTTIKIRSHKTQRHKGIGYFQMLFCQTRNCILMAIA